MRTDAGAAGGTGTEAGAEAGAKEPRARTAPRGARPRAMVLDAVCAIDAAHERDDAVLAHGDWQRERPVAWRELRTVEHSPVLWGAFATISTV
ncbi:hypothetical protein OIE62_26930 [Streptomyces scopuliridis]|uniref:Uncharacterized protein n=1 Tax=Streptomyces scopuliridis TaxID=452529 RepID=A0ACD4ZLM8_9ACTN|nr:hypothetical protein [Streptomyces scopuliridis]WSB98026.1 hypothetical protein OG835_14010 [Streptomyces scopuliridis]WSC08272.1 hypothetical protein OIE62_26930 [Streptomyces scopuliridis]